MEIIRGQLPPLARSWNRLWKKENKPQYFHRPNKNIFSIIRNKLSSGAARADSYCVIDLDSASLKLVQLSKSASGYSITRAVYQNLAEAATSPQVIKKNLEKLIAQYQLSGAAALLIAPALTRVYSFVLPHMPDSEIEQAVAWKVKQGLASDTQFSNLSLDYAAFSHSGKDLEKEMHVLAFTAQKEAVTEQVNLFSGLPLKLETVSPQPYCTFLCLDYLKQISPEETVLILDLGRDESSVIIAHAGQPRLVRPLAVSGNKFTDTIAAYHRIDRKKAEEAKICYGLSATGQESMCLAALSSQLEGLIVELEHAFRLYLQQINKAGAGLFEKIIICGQAASIRGLDVFLSRKLQVAARIFDPFSAAKFPLIQPLDALTKENACGFCAAVGAALNINDR